jgi:hypothetical protein
MNESLPDARTPDGEMSDIGSSRIKEKVLRDPSVTSTSSSRRSTNFDFKRLQQYTVPEASHWDSDLDDEQFMIDMFDGFDNKRIEQYTVPETTIVDLRPNEFPPQIDQFFDPYWTVAI